jgi:hypothetical protein
MGFDIETSGGPSAEPMQLDVPPKPGFNTETSGGSSAEPMELVVPPRPMGFNTETSGGPSAEQMQLDVPSKLGFNTETSGGSSAEPMELVVPPRPMGFDTETSGDPSENPMQLVPAKPIDPVSSGPSEEPMKLADPPALVPSPEPLEPKRLNFAQAPQSITTREREVQLNVSRSSTPRLDMRKLDNAKRRRNQDTNVTKTQVEKTRLVPQDVLTTRVALQEKERSIELLKDEASGQLPMIQRILRCFVVCS